ncbi:MAG: hypothetical protein AAF487_11895 [Bacteroidota bacterium]
MKTRIFLQFILLVFCVNGILAQSDGFTVYEKVADATPNIYDNPPYPNDPALTKLQQAEVVKMRAYGGWRNGVNGIICKLDIDTEYLDGKSLDVVAWFYFWNGDPDSKQQKLKDFNGRYRTTNYQVSTSTRYTPTYKNNSRSDFELFIPFSELHLGIGVHWICFDFGVFRQNKQLTVSDYLVGKVY